MTLFDNAAHPRSAVGTFATKVHSDPQVALTTAAMPAGGVTIETVNGPVAVVLGVLDGKVIDAYESGQCVSMAVALASLAGESTIGVAVKEGTGDDPERIIHAFVETGTPGNSQVHDVNGAQDAEEYFDFLTEQYGEGWSYFHMSIEDAAAINSSPLGFGLPEQDFATARLFAPLVPR